MSLRRSSRRRVMSRKMLNNLAVCPNNTNTNNGIENNTIKKAGIITKSCLSRKVLGKLDNIREIDNRGIVKTNVAGNDDQIDLDKSIVKISTLESPDRTKKQSYNSNNTNTKGIVKYNVRSPKKINTIRISTSRSPRRTKKMFNNDRNTNTRRIVKNNNIENDDIGLHSSLAKISLKKPLENPRNTNSRGKIKDNQDLDMPVLEESPPEKSIAIFSARRSPRRTKKMFNNDRNTNTRRIVKYDNIENDDIGLHSSLAKISLKKTLENPRNTNSRGKIKDNQDLDTPVLEDSPPEKSMANFSHRRSPHRTKKMFNNDRNTNTKRTVKYNNIENDDIGLHSSLAKIALKKPLENPRNTNSGGKIKDNQDLDTPVLEDSPPEKNIQSRDGLKSRVSNPRNTNIHELERVDELSKIEKNPLRNRKKKNKKNRIRKSSTKKNGANTMIKNTKISVSSLQKIKIEKYNTQKDETNDELDETNGESPEQIKKVKLSAQQLLIEMKKSLHLSWDPDMILGRDEEYAKIKKFLKRGLEFKRGDSMYVAGAPGTGKTLLIRHVLSTTHSKSKNVQMIEFNATGMGGNPKKTYRSLLEKLGQKSNLANATELLKDRLISSNEKSKMIIMFIDEIDQLFSKKQEVLTDLFSWAKDPFSKFLLIGAANTLDHTRFLSYLSCNKDLQPEVIMFSPYSEHQLYTIMCQRLKQPGQTNVEDDEVPFFDLVAIELCARKVSASSGDIRKCLNICCTCLDKLSIGEDRKESMPKVSMFEMSQVIRSAFGASGRGGQEQFVLLRNLPRHQKITLVLIVLAIEYFPTANTPERLEYMVTQLRRVLKVPTVASYEYEDAITALGAVKLLKINKKRGRKKAKIESRIYLEDIKRILKNEDFIMKLILRGETRLRSYKQVEKSSQSQV